MKRIGPQISERSFRQLAELSVLFESQRVAIERAIEDAYKHYINVEEYQCLTKTSDTSESAS